MLLIEASSSSWSAVPVVPLDLTALYASYTSFLSDVERRVRCMEGLFHVSIL